MIDKTITHEQARKHFDNHKQQLEDYYGPFEDDDIDVIDNYITQQEQFAKDVARYFELELKIVELHDLTADEYTEYVELYGKLTKGVTKWVTAHLKLTHQVTANAQLS